jgi:hypothetical protein
MRTVRAATDPVIREMLGGVNNGQALMSTDSLTGGNIFDGSKHGELFHRNINIPSGKVYAGHAPLGSTSSLLIDLIQIQMAQSSAIQGIPNMSGSGSDKSTTSLYIGFNMYKNSLRTYRTMMSSALRILAWKIFSRWNMEDFANQIAGKLKASSEKGRAIGHQSDGDEQVDRAATDQESRDKSNGSKKKKRKQLAERPDTRDSGTKRRQTSYQMLRDQEENRLYEKLEDMYIRVSEHDFSIKLEDVPPPHTVLELHANGFMDHKKAIELLASGYNMSKSDFAKEHMDPTTDMTVQEAQEQKIKDEIKLVKAKAASVGQNGSGKAPKAGPSANGNGNPKTKTKRPSEVSHAPFMRPDSETRARSNK